MHIRAVSFDIGHTLIRYKSLLNWKSLYVPAIERVAASCDVCPSDSRVQDAINVLPKFNTRENPREYEVSSHVIFREIFDAWTLPYDRLELAIPAFFSFFQAGAECYDDAVDTLSSDLW